MMRVGGDIVIGDGGSKIIRKRLLSMLMKLSIYITMH